MTATPRARRFTALLHAAALLCAAVSCSEPAPERPNVVLISIDTLRADHASCYGYARKTTPNLDQLARDGVLFERAVAPTSWTLPSHVTMLTGLSISAHGACDERLWRRTKPNGERIPPPLRGATLASALKKRGYRTAGFYTFEFLDSTFGFAEGFDTWERCGHTFYTHPEVREELVALRRAGDKAAVDALVHDHADLFDPRHRSTPEIVARANAWLDERAHALETGAEKEPFFLFLHLYDVHDPYKPPPEHDLFGDPNYRGKVDGTIDYTLDPRIGHRGPPEDHERLVSLYDGGIHAVDAGVGEVLKRLHALGFDENTLVIVTADHGEEFFEHGEPQHRRQLYIESLHVPLVMRWPARLEGGRRVGGTVGLSDIAPTILEATDVRPLAPMSGRSLLSLARGQKELTRRTYGGLLHLFGYPDGVETNTERLVTFFRGDEQVILHYCPGEEFRGELWNLAKDPTESGAPVLFRASSDLGREIQKELDSRRERIVQLRDRAPQRGVQLPPLDDRMRQALTTTGYVSGDNVGGEHRERLCGDGCVFWPE